MSGTAGELAQVTRAGAAVDDTDDEEERRLEQRVPQHERETGEGRRLRPGADDRDEEAELAHGAVGEEELDVVLAQRTKPPRIIVTRPVTSSRGATRMSEKAGASSATRKTPA